MGIDMMAIGEMISLLDMESFSSEVEKQPKEIGQMGN
jgi:hypothetical protein